LRERGKKAVARITGTQITANINSNPATKGIIQQQALEGMVSREVERLTDGYWKLEKPMKDCSWQPIDPSTMNPGTHRETHVPFPPRGSK
jgi:beta-galactosidase/beta-glucuronidase